MNVPLNAREGANEGGPSTLAPPKSHTSPGDVNTRRRVGAITPEELPRSDARPLDAARAYIAHGLAVVPCCAPLDGGERQCTAEAAGLDTHKGHGAPDAHGKIRAGKIPTASWHNRRATTLAEAARWWAHSRPHGPNIALLMGPGGVIALDVDGPAGEATLAAAVEVLGALPPTLENVTGRDGGGRHLLFRVPSDASDDDVRALVKSGAALRLDVEARRFAACSAGDEGSGLDLRAGDDVGRSYIMVAPSLHASGKRYQWRGGPLAELPAAWWLALPRKGARPGTVTAGPRSSAARSGQGELAGLGAPSTSALAGELVALNELRASEGLPPRAALCGCRMCSDCLAVRSLRAGDIDGARMMLSAPVSDEHAAGDRIASALPSTPSTSPPPGQRSVSLAVRYAAALREALPRELATIPTDTPDSPTNDTIRDVAVRVIRLALGAGEAAVTNTVEAVTAAGLASGHPEGAVRATIAGALAFARSEGPPKLSERERAPKPRTRKAPRASEGEASDDEASDAGDDAPESRPAVTSRSGLPLVIVGADVARMADEAVSALARHPDVYQRTGVGLVRIIEAVEPDDASENARELLPAAGSLTIKGLAAPTVGEWLSMVAEFRAYDRRVTKGDGTRRVQPPGGLPVIVCAREVYPREVRPLAGIIEAPALRRDGSCITAAGYDARSGLYLRWAGEPVDVADAPTRDDARAAFGVFEELFADFVFQGDENARRVSLAATVAAILTPLARAAIDGPVPAFMWSADASLAGKSMLASTCGAVVLGQTPPPRQYTPDDDEMAKRIAAVAVSGAPLWFLDNIRAHLEGGALELLLTAHDRIAARILGATVDREMRWRAVTYMTGNGASYSADIARRLLHIPLLSCGRREAGAEAGTSERTFRFELPSHALANRARYVRAALVMLRAHLAAGRPSSGAALPSFEAWSRVVAHAVWWASGADPINARPPESANRDHDVARRVALAWHSAAPSEALTLASVRARVAAVEPGRGGAEPGRNAALVELASALAELAGAPDLARVSPHALGRRFEQHVADRSIPHPDGGSVRIAAAGLLHGSKRYASRREGPAIRPAAPPSETAGQLGGWGSGGSGGSVHSHSGSECDVFPEAGGGEAGTVAFDA